MKNTDNRERNWISAGTSYTSDSFLLDNLMFFRKNIEQFLLEPIGDWKGAPVNTRLICSSTFHMYDIHTREGKVIDAKQFYNALTIFKNNGGLSKIDEEYMYDKAVDNNFIIHCILTSSHM